MAKKTISAKRKTLYYLGMGMTGVGLLLFLSTFIQFMRPQDLFGAGPGSMMTRPFIGILMIAGGQFLRHLGARGSAGSGLVLDPEKARDDLAPWSKMAGGMVNDALDETELKKDKEVIRVRCRSCGTLNDEEARFCDQCGEPL